MGKKIPKNTTRTGVRMTKDGPRIVQTKPAKGLLSKIVKATTGK